MLLAEKFILLHIDEKKGKIPWLGHIIVNKSYGTSIGSLVLMELILKKKITFETIKKKTFIRVIDDSTTGDKFLDESLAMIQDYKKKKTLKKLESVLVNLSRFTNLKKRMRLFNNLFERLDQQGIIRIEKKFKTGGNPARMFSGGRQALIQPEVKRNILSEILDVVNNNKEPSESTVLLITLLNAKEDFLMFPKESRKFVKEQFKEFCMKDLSSFGETIEKVRRMMHQVMKVDPIPVPGVLDGFY